MQVAFAMSLRFLTILICAWPFALHAAPPLAVAPHLESLPTFVPLELKNGKWLVKGEETDDQTVMVVSHSSRAYATIEAFGEDLTLPVTLQFRDGESGQILDTIEIPIGTTAATLRTIPLVASRILVRTAGPPASGGQVTISRVLVPKPSAGVPHGFTESITPVISYRGTIDPNLRALFDAATSVALLQISKPRETVACTAFLVAQDALATAGHCVRILMPSGTTPDWQNAPCAMIGVLFDFLDASNGSGARAAHCQAIKILPKSDALVELSDLDALTLDMGDVAVLRVDPAAARRPDGGTRQPLLLKDLRNKSLASVVSYPQGDIEGVASNCEVYGNIREALVLHRCSTAPGSSGAPVMELTGAGWQVVGLHVCCDGGPIDGFTWATVINAGRRINLALRPSLIADLLR
jgi:V8-like Glu-specific endopeptidase